MPTEPSTKPEHQANNEQNTLKAVVDKGKRSSRRRIPFVVLVALAVMLTASLAFAAYSAYVAIDGSTTQTEQTQDARAIRLKAIEADPTKEAVKKAKKNYKKVLKEYESAFKKIDSTGSVSLSSYKYLSEDNLEVWAPDYCGLYDPIDTSTFRYAYKDLDGDDIPELIIGTTNPIWSTMQDGLIPKPKTGTLDIWTYKQSKLVEIAVGPSIKICKKGYIASFSAYTDMSMDCTIYKIKSGKLNPESWTNNINQIAKLKASCSGLPNRYEYSIKAKGKTSSFNELSEEDFESKVNNFLDKYPEDTSLKWKVL